jgi:hypothetical protein
VGQYKCTPAKAPYGYGNGNNQEVFNLSENLFLCNLAHFYAFIYS